MLPLSQQSQSHRWKFIILLSRGWSVLKKKITGDNCIAKSSQHHMQINRCDHMKVRVNSVSCFAWHVYCALIERRWTLKIIILSSKMKWCVNHLYVQMRRFVNVRNIFYRTPAPKMILFAFCSCEYIWIIYSFVVDEYRWGLMSAS